MVPCDPERLEPREQRRQELPVGHRSCLVVHRDGHGGSAGGSCAVDGCAGTPVTALPHLTPGEPADRRLEGRLDGPTWLCNGLHRMRHDAVHVPRVGQIEGL